MKSIIDPSNHFFRDNRNEVFEYLKTNSPSGNSSIYMQGGVLITRNDDVDFYFRQESNFMFLTGLEYPDMSILMIESTGQSVLIIPEATVYYATVVGEVKTKEQLQQMFDFDLVLYNSEVNNYFSQNNIDTVYTMPGTNITFTGTYTVNTNNLTTYLYDARTIKSDKEIQLMEQVAIIGSEAHKYAMKNIKKNNATEFDIETLFLFICQSCSMKHQSYPPIIAGNNRSAILHYIENNKAISPDLMVLADAGPEFNGYGTDITRTWPISGVFTEIQKQLYEAVLNVQQKSIDILQPGLTWNNLSSYANSLIVDELYSLDIFKPSLRESPQYTNILMRIFYLHGLGHLVGLDVHDTYSSPSVLREGMVITIEPGIYFNRVVIEQNLLKNDTLTSFINVDRMNQFLSLGGVRIEDVLLITNTSYRFLSTAPRTVSDIEKWMKN
eukprot:TRINITY_DN1173_c0_g1_i2.p1 TRINITY_DN1173_c0_g1~~TRINITY_DN1173_c0_g1_i2.p1  ORF type:complete len:440 (-),score=92.78 TRINITY_DN1173_c0_g1_i2:55-1374(-)